MNQDQQAVYQALKANPPVSRLTGLGAAFYLGYDHPTLPVGQAGPAAGLPGSKARAAYKAGQTAAKAAQNHTRKKA
ncbi:hypothetical protein HA052_04460 [Chromobacterium haemolyticum]|uniref:Uncharacterized protein n=1 Tax=Chromobacterium fluminis TaxID=3044269 RepID=A0ABX0L5U9_9NEIS|nr:hypothetical protein [Chromobacterium haemolyticum]NHR04443.1 hypothetical protein [Chromobacterium haemolyticum]